MKQSSLIAVISNTRKERNEDCIGSFTREDYTAVVLADGIGSSPLAKESSAYAVSCMEQHMPALAGEIDFTALFRTVRDGLIHERANRPMPDSGESLFGTTLICVVETEHDFRIAYAGNGAVWHLRGHYQSFSRSKHIPWSAVNLLNPHSISEQGKEALCRYLSDNNDDEQCKPSVLTFSKDTVAGDIVIACTDGIDSADHMRVGKNKSGVWMQFNPFMQALYDHLGGYLGGDAAPSAENFQNMLNEYFHSVYSSLEDDASVGIILTEPVLKLQQSKPVTL
jgi:PPM family protein phosphatase